MAGHRGRPPPEGGPPRVVLHGALARARRRGRRVAHPLPGNGRRRGGGPAMSAARLARAAARRRAACARPTRWAIEERGIPGAAADGARGGGPGARRRRRAPAGPGRGRLRRGQQRRRRLRRGAPAARGRPRGRRAAACRPGGAQRRRGGNARAPAGDPPRPFAPGSLDGAAAIVDAMLGTGFSGAPREPVAGASRPSTLRARPSSPATSQRRRRLHRRGRRARRPRRRHRHVPRREARACGSRPASRTPARSRWSTSASGGGAGPARGRA